MRDWISCSICQRTNVGASGERRGEGNACAACLRLHAPASSPFDELAKLAATNRAEFAARMTELCMGPEPAPAPPRQPFIDRTGVGGMSWTGVATVVVFVMVLASFVIPAVWGAR